MLFFCCQFHDALARPLREVVLRMLEMPENVALAEHENANLTLTLRFSCDGAKMSKHKQCVKGVVKLVREDGTHNSPHDEYTLFMYMGR